MGELTRYTLINTPDGADLRKSSAGDIYLALEVQAAIDAVNKRAEAAEHLALTRDAARQHAEANTARMESRALAAEAECAAAVEILRRINAAEEAYQADDSETYPFGVLAAIDLPKPGPGAALLDRLATAELQRDRACMLLAPVSMELAKVKSDCFAAIAEVGVWSAKAGALEAERDEVMAARDDAINVACKQGCKLTDAIQARDDARAKLGELESKLPKTVDGVVATPGMRLYDLKGNPLWVEVCTTCGDERIFVTPDEWKPVYSIPGAATAARTREGGGK